MIKRLKCLNVEYNVCFPTHIKMECFIFLGVNGSSKLQLYGIHGYQAESSCYSSFEWDFLCEWGTATEHIYIYIYTWTFRWMETAWWFGTWIWWLSIQLRISSSQLTFTPSFFRGVGQLNHQPGNHLHCGILHSGNTTQSSHSAAPLCTSLLCSKGSDFNNHRDQSNEEKRGKADKFDRLLRQYMIVYVYMI